ncbi:probable cytochrome P450 6a13 [Uranotaenia lowii]|uniref:probable cytochrome P450 6a13 n=1 Tax=Uranotaenia lowii TaxID=190385 RepID=UPI0024795E7F|nr:probable cytochrome P450 6a13 [Uranotaenia lowii]
MFIYFLLVLLLALYCWIQSCYSYWSRRNVPHAPPTFPFGNLRELQQKPMFLSLTEFYNRHKAPGVKFIGLYSFLKPVVLIADLDMMKDVLLKDFEYFHDRGIYNNDKANPIGAHLITLEGTRWKNVRSKLTPAFTSGKIRLMYPTMKDVAKRLWKQVQFELDHGDEIEMKDIFARFTTDVIGSCAFGLNCDSLENPKAIFREMGRVATEQSAKTKFLRDFCNTFPRLGIALGIKVIDDEVEKFFFDTVRETINHRKANNVRRGDFLDILIRMQKDETSSGEANDLGGWQFHEIVAQCFVFFLAAFETSSTAMSFCMYELARNPELQEKARLEIEQVLAKHGSSFTYEAIHEMKYLENCINESMRLYPPASISTRVVTKDYHVPEMNVTIEKGTRVMLPFHAFHNDPANYPEPERFDPDRFTPETMASWHPLQFMPFGYGARNCIGMRFGMMQIRLGMAYLLKNFRFMLSPKTSVPPQFNPVNILTGFQGGLWINVESVEHVESAQKMRTFSE